MDNYAKDSDIFGHVLRCQVPCAVKDLLKASNLRQLAELTWLSSLFKKPGVVSDLELHQI